MILYSSATPSVSPVAPSITPGSSSTPLAPSTPVATTPAAPTFTGGASRVAGAGAGLASLFAAAAFLL